ncbi:MAG TPA: class I SAM-dependent methyltransferase [Streptosporangiaceae bacterium]|nr:class I SAM-dependent methyltransferase [Streptosporangiaceae bacterium]
MDVVQRVLTDKPMFHQGGEERWDALPETLEAIRSFARPGASTLELGVGVSTVVFAAAGTSHVAISPDPVEHERVQAYCRSIGVDDSGIRFVVGLSDDVLPSMLGRERTLDLALIDGGHLFPVPVIDWYYVSRALKVGGKLIMDDVPIPAVAPVMRHMSLESNWRLDGIFDDRAAAFTLLAEADEVPWPDQPFNKGYPDFSFLAGPRRLRLQAGYRLRELRRTTGQRHPGLRRLYKRVT